MYGEDGYEIDPDDEDERYEEAMAEAADGYPYANIRIEGTESQLVVDRALICTFRVARASHSCFGAGDTSYHGNSFHFCHTVSAHPKCLRNVTKGENVTLENEASFDQDGRRPYMGTNRYV